MQVLCLVNTVQGADFLSLSNVPPANVSLCAEGWTRLRCGTTITNASEFFLFYLLF